MWSEYWIVFGVAVTATLAATQTPKCDDVDTSACQLLQSQRHDFCKDEAVVRSICPRFCKLCPIECYHCDTTYTDYHQCNTTVLCQSGEVCMKKELISFADGHHEYEMTCQDKIICDGGSDLTIPFGKRHVNSRDISVMCCVDDLCNYPEQTTTTTTTTTTTPTTTHKPVGCPKDIAVMVDASSAILKSEGEAVNDLIAALVQRLDIGVNDNLLGLFTFDKSLYTKFDMNHYTSKASLLSAIHRTQMFTTSTGHTFIVPNTTLAVQQVVSHLTYAYKVDRTTHPDAVLLIGSALTTTVLKLSDADLARLQRLSRDVIVLDVGPKPSTTGFLSNLLRPHDGTLATDNHHVINVKDLQHHTISSIALVDKIVQLLKHC